MRSFWLNGTSSGIWAIGVYFCFSSMILIVMGYYVLFPGIYMMLIQPIVHWSDSNKFTDYTTISFSLRSKLSMAIEIIYVWQIINVIFCSHLQVLYFRQ